MLHSQVESVKRYDRGEIQGSAFITDEGYIRAKAIVTRTGVFEYKNEDGSLRRELRHPEDVWNEDSLSSMELIPVTNNHPPEMLVNSENFKRLAIGYTGETIQKEGQFIFANVVITDAEGIDWVKNQGRKQLSLGYTVDLVPESGDYHGVPYDYRQTNIKYNHLAVVNRARAGSEAQITLDRADTFEILKEGELMKKKIKIDEEEMLVEPAIAEYIQRLYNDLSMLRETRDRIEAEIDQLKTKLETIEAERDSLKDQLEEVKEEVEEEVTVSMDSKEFKSRVKQRVSLLKAADDLLDKDSKTNLDSLEDLAIKKKVISKHKKTICLDGKSEAYIEALFDTILDEKKQQKVNVDNVTFKGDSQGHESPTESARKKMIENNAKLSKRV